MKDDKLLDFFQPIMPEVERERKQPYTESELREVQKIMKDFGIRKEDLEKLPENVKSYGQLHRWKCNLISELLEKYVI